MDQKLKDRIKTALIMAFPILVLILLALYSAVGQTILSVLGLLIIIVCAWELTSTCVNQKAHLKSLVYFTLCILAPLGTLAYGFSENFQQPALEELAVIIVATFFTYLALVFSGLYAFLSGRNNPEQAVDVLRELPIGILLIGFCGSCLVVLVQLEQGVLLLLWLILVVVANDIAAYFGGNKFGGAKLSPYVSPNKTISGSCSGLLAGMLVGFLFSFLLPAQNWILVLSLATAIGLAGQVGDLVKSYLKRLHNVKDMGTILPGHGGLLDRIDGILMAAPWAIFFLSFS